MSKYILFVKLNFWKQNTDAIHNFKIIVRFSLFKHYLYKIYIQKLLKFLYIYAHLYVHIKHRLILELPKWYTESHQEWNLNTSHVLDCRFVMKLSLPRCCPIPFRKWISKGDFVSKRISTRFPKVIVSPMKYGLPRSKFNIKQIQCYFI